MIVKEGDRYKVKSESGKNLGSYKSKKEAAERLRQIEAYKSKGKK